MSIPAQVTGKSCTCQQKDFLKISVIDILNPSITHDKLINY